MSSHVTCAWCNKEHEPIFADTKQGSGCAAYVWFDVASARWYLQACYGSCHDTTRFWFQHNLPTRGTDPVCDACITVRLEQGDLVEVSGHFL